MQTAVTNTSIRAYHEGQQDRTLGKSAERVAREILKRTRAGQRSWIGQLARDLDLEKSSVSGRLNDLKKLQAIQLDGHAYRLEFAGNVTDREGSGKRAETWSLILIPPTGAQTALFQ
jgi:hypothetical protein